ncbi:MAG: nuclear transport factor 2 family protein [Corynebacteriales bacterium]|nr:nuclear transport factor 2 family protein [Mycobacteriales bacterium]
MDRSVVHSPSPLAIYKQMQEAVLRDDQSTLLPASLLHEKLLVETPFAPAGMRRYESREAWLSYYASAGAGLLVRFEEFRELATYQTADPDTIVVEYELTGVVRVTGVRATVTCIAVLRVEDGLIIYWREYQDIPTITEALSRQPENRA